MVRLCQTKQQWIELGILLRAVAPPPVEKGNSKHGMVDPIARRLGGAGSRLQTGSRIRRGVPAPYAFQRAINDRVVFDEMAAEAARPREELAPGDAVLCRGELARLEWFDGPSGRCGVTFSYEGVEETVLYGSRFARVDGQPRRSCARLQRPQPSLQPPPRATSKQSVSLETKAHVHEIFELTCPTSPHQKDSRRRHLGRNVWQSLQAMIQTLTLDEIFRVFKKTYPLDKLAYTQFRLLKPWNLIKAYRETCLCRVCEMFRLYIQALHVVAELLKPLVEPVERGADGNGDAEAEVEEAEAEAADPDLKRLAWFCSLPMKSDMVKEMICAPCLTEAQPECVDGSCSTCGIGKIWSRGMRPKVVGTDGELLEGVSPIWGQEVRYEVLKSSGSTPSDGSNTEDKDSLRAQRMSSVVDFLDEFEEASAKFPKHRHLVGDTKAKAKQRDQNFWPGMLLSDYDWSENGIIALARQIQSEYWSLTHYSLFISITSYLLVNFWLNRSSVLSKGTEVTVEPCDLSQPGTLVPAKGSFYATIHSVVSTEGEGVIYSVQKADGTVVGGVERAQLRHRKKHTTAFIGVTDEKRHDAPSTQHFLNKQFQHWLLHLDEGKFWAWLGHSDNASHFKSGSMLNYWSGKMSELDFLKACWIEFGCPGHGKGPWDGMGAVMKQAVTRDITNGRILTLSGYIRNPEEVAEHLTNRFQTDEWKAAHADKSIHEIIVNYTPHDKITERPVVEPAFEPLTGKMDSFSFLVLGRDQIARRRRSCWCEACFHVRGRATLDAVGQDLLCKECTSATPLPWHEQSAKNLGTGLAGRRKEAQEKGHSFAPNLKGAGFFAIQARERWSLKEDSLYRPGHFWVAQAPDVREVRRITKRETICGQPFHPGDYMIRIGRYFDRVASDPSGLKFEEWQPELVFSVGDVGEKLTISASGHVKVGRAARDEIFWGAASLS